MLVGTATFIGVENNQFSPSAFYHNTTELFISAFQPADNGEINNEKCKLDYTTYYYYIFLIPVTRSHSLAQTIRQLKLLSSF